MHRKLEDLPRGGRTRLAPTPSGWLHAGNALNFLLTARIAQATGSSILLRIDDLDRGRTRPAYVEDIFRSLLWLGVHWDEGPQGPKELADRWTQLHRLPRYHRMIEDLRRLGALYACSCSRVEFQRSTGQGVHACSCRDRGLDFDAPGVAWRLRLIEGDLVRIPGLFGREGVVDLFARMGDPVVRQRDGMPAYQVASLADDVDFGITFIVRGEDLLPSTACQLVIAGLLQLGSLANVRFVHHPLITDHIGRKLSKSEGAFSLKAMREAGSGPDALWHEADSLLERLLIGAEEGR